MKRIHSFDLIYDSQQLYRVILEACANPGRALPVRKFAEKMYGSQPAMLAVAVTLLDNEVSFCTGGDEELSSQIIALTLAHEAGPEDADFIFVTEQSKLPELMRRAKSGTLTDPHKSATLIIDTSGSEQTDIKISGPGIRDLMTLTTAATARQALTLRKDQYHEYPQGIDLMFISENQELMMLPRLVTQEVF